MRHLLAWCPRPCCTLFPASLGALSSAADRNALGQPTLSLQCAVQVIGHDVARPFSSSLWMGNGGNLGVVADGWVKLPCTFHHRDGDSEEVQEVGNMTGYQGQPPLEEFALPIEERPFLGGLLFSFLLWFYSVSSCLCAFTTFFNHAVVNSR